MDQTKQANIIKVAAVITATPRWVGALLAAEGFTLPADWRWWWIPTSAILSAAMALVEGLAFAYVFNAWRMQTDKKASRLLWLAILSAIVFVIVLAPFIAAQVRQATLEQVLGQGWALWLWSSAVAASTIVIVASVGYAQKERQPSQSGRKEKQERPQAKAEAPQERTGRPQATASDSQERHAAKCPVAGCEWNGRSDGYATAQAAQNALNAHVGHAHSGAQMSQDGRNGDTDMTESIGREYDEGQT